MDSPTTSAAAGKIYPLEFPRVAQDIVAMRLDSEMPAELPLPAGSRVTRETLGGELLAATGSQPVEWVVSDAPVPYPEAVAAMEAHIALMAEGEAAERVWLLEHPPLYTAGTSARDEDLLAADRFPVYRSGRGGEYTYHGPGQRIAYVMLDLSRRRPDVRRYVAALEAWMIATLARFNVRGEVREDRVGVWVKRPEKAPLFDGSVAEDKIAAIGIRVRRWITFHGVSLNVEPDLDHFSGIVPCGIRGYGVTSLVDLGLPVTMPEVDSMLRAEFQTLFGPTIPAPSIPPP